MNTAGGRGFDGRSGSILNGEVERTRGEAARSTNLSVGIVLGDLVRTTLGPLGMDKMLVDGQGDVVVSNEGSTILDEIGLEHPAAGIVLEGAKSQRDDVGDGTTTVTVLVGELLDNAADLIDRGLHPRTVIDGYHRGGEYALRRVGERAVEVGPGDVDTLSAVARTATNGGIVIDRDDEIAEIAVRAVRAVAEDGRVDLGHLGTEAVAGETFADSRLVDGVVINRDAVRSSMPTRIEGARIAIVDRRLELQEPTPTTGATVSRPDQLRRFRDREKRRLHELGERIVSTGANMVVTEESIDGRVGDFLAENGVLALRRAKDTDLDHLARATGGRRIATVEELDESNLGEAGLVEQRQVGDRELFFVEECESPESVTLLVRGGTKQVAESTERVIANTFEAVATAIETGSVLPGGGATELRLSLVLREHAEGVGGREQLAVRALADALEVVPRTLAENGGRSPIDGIVELRSRHAAGQSDAGLDATSGEVRDMIDEGVVEPTAVKRRAIARSLNIANVLLQIDDVFVHPNEIDRAMPDTGGLDDGPAV